VTVIGTELPALDCHAHIAPDVTSAQIRSLGDAFVFAVTRSLAEADYVTRRADHNLTWGLGVHPGVKRARAAFDESEFRRLLPYFSVVGEIGLDRRAGDLPDQARILRTVLTAAAAEPVLLSVHSAGAARPFLDILSEHPHPGLILHWFTGTASETDAAIATGAWFSVNAAMTDAVLDVLPPDRVLPETDFPAHRTLAGRPGDTAALETRLAGIWGTTRGQVRHRCWANLRRLAVHAGALDRLPAPLAERLLEV
jgi:TatD DNase family protein